MDRREIEAIKCKIYKILTLRYKDTIAKMEEKSIAELRERTSPFSDDIREVAEEILQNAEKDEMFSRVMRYLRGITVVELSIPFHLNIKEIHEYRFATSIDKAIIGTGLLRYIGIDAKVYITRENVYIGFSLEGTEILLNVKTMNTLQGKEAEEAFIKDPLRYVFNDSYSEIFG